MTQRAGLAALVAAAIAVGAPAGAQAGEPGAPLLPDLAPAALERGPTIGLYPDGERVILDVGFKAPNVGAGPLELAPLPEPPEGDPAADCDGDGNPENDRPQRQTVYLDADANGRFDPAVDTGTQARGDGCSVYHQGHSHWHAATLTTDLIAQRKAPPARALDKPTFCLADAGVFDAALPGAPPSRAYPVEGCGVDVPQGISVGWFDRYSVGLPGQQLDVTGLGAGTYCVRQSFDSTGSIDELDETNNVVETAIRLDPATRDLQVLPGVCVPGPTAVDTTAPDTRIARAPGLRTRTRRRNAVVKFGFTATEPGARLACSVDGSRFRRCDSPFEARLRARRGRWTAHEFAVTATDSAGNRDSSPAEWTGVVKRRR